MPESRGSSATMKRWHDNWLVGFTLSWFLACTGMGLLQFFGLWSVLDCAAHKVVMDHTPTAWLKPHDGVECDCCEGER